MVNVQELGYQKTPLGDLVLRRRAETLLGGREVFEVKLGEEYLMSSLFTEAERQLATLGLAGLDGELDVVVGGLGLGYTAAEALKNERVSRLLVIDLFQAVIDWHRAGIVPNGEALTRDARCELRQGDFFELARTGFDEHDPARKFDAVLLDIDHSPEHFLDAGNKSLYTPEGLAAVRNQLKPNGSFALWSNDLKDNCRANCLGRLDGKTNTAHGFGTPLINLSVEVTGGADFASTETSITTSLEMPPIGHGIDEMMVGEIKAAWNQAKDFAYAIAPDYAKLQGGIPGFGNIELSVTKDYRFYFGGSKGVGDGRNIIDQLSNFNVLDDGRPKSLGIKPTGSFTLGYFTGRMTEEGRHQAMEGPNVNGTVPTPIPGTAIGVTQSLPTGGQSIANAPRAVEVGIPSSIGVGVGGSGEILPNVRDRVRHFMDRYPVQN